MAHRVAGTLEAGETLQEKTTGAASSVTLGTEPPPIHFNLWREKKWGIVRYWTLIMFCNLALPCVIFYPIREYTSLSLQDAIGAGSASLGVSAIFEFPLRVYSLWRYRDQYGPLDDDVWWHFDSFMFSYTLAMLVAAVPLAVAPAVDPPLVTFFLMFTAILIAELGANMLPTLFKFKTPIWMSSDPPGTQIKPAVFYYVEDICAVDARKGRPFRREWNNRYNASPPFRALMYQLTIFWVIGCFMYAGVTALVTWLTPINFAYVYTLGQLFIWGLVWMLLTWAWVHRSLKRERKWWANRAKLNESPPSKS